MQITQNSINIVNAEGLIMGRMASKVAKLLLNGNKVVIINAEKTIISGNKRSKVAEAMVFLEVGSPKRGPFHYRRPDKILRKTVRGMLPHRQPKGRTAYKKLKVFLGIPKEFEEKQMITLKDAKASKLTGPYFTLGELAREIGWNTGR
ncbi:MAG TPA: 50S ribosomal protein L13 [Candidatus Glassbacteria bacterium]|nr:50S ribosomal protein L13 [Candidatus Glassbacteria bacterium]